MPSIVTERFVKCYLFCKEKGLVRSGRHFASELGYQPQNLSEIVRGKRDAPAELIRKAVEKFDFNPCYLYLGEGNLLGARNQDDFKVLTIVTNSSDQEKIVHIPVPAQAGYSQELHEPLFLQQLPSYRLPDHKYAVGSYRSFDVAGESMEPTLYAGTKVICHFIEPNQWISSVKDHHVYVVVTRTGILIKRLVNHLQKHRHFELHSDNPHFAPVRLNVGEIREIWMVSATIAEFSHSLPLSKKQPDIEKLHETIDEQSALIHKLHDKLEQILVPT